MGEDPSVDLWMAEVCDHLFDDFTTHQNKGKCKFKFIYTLKLMKVNIHFSNTPVILLFGLLLETSQTSYTTNFSQLCKQMQYQTILLNLLTIIQIYRAVILMAVVLCFSIREDLGLVESCFTSLKVGLWGLNEIVKCFMILGAISIFS